MADQQHFRSVVDIVQKAGHTEVAVDTATNDPAYVGGFVAGLIVGSPALFKPLVKIVLRDFRGIKVE